MTPRITLLLAFTLGCSTPPREPTGEPVRAAGDTSLPTRGSAPTPAPTLATTPADTPAKPWPNVVAATSCAGHGRQISRAGTPFTQDGTVVKMTLQWGCGCASGPVHVLAYEPSDPLRVRLCFDQSKDACEMACQRTVGFDVGAALATAGASAITFVDP